MSCCFPSQSSSASQIEDRSCWQKQPTKVALFVISLLCAGGALAFHFTGLGMPGIIAFSVASGASMAIFVATCIYSSSSKMSDRQLLNGMLSNDKDHQLMITTLGPRIQTLFSNTYQGVDSTARRLQPFFSSEAVASEKFPLFVALIAKNSGRALSFTTAVLEQVEWPTTQERKQEIILQGLKYAILTGSSLNNFLSWEDSNINLNQTTPHRLIVITKNIFGHGDFTQSRIPIPNILVSAIGSAIATAARLMLLDLQKKQKEGTIDEETKIGLEVVIEQYRECRFPASMLAPILPHLINIPGLVGLQLSDVGISGPSDYLAGKVREGHGFKDEHAEALLAVLGTNPYLTEVKICIDGMSEGGADKFIEQWSQIEEQKKIQGKPFSIEQVLALTAANTTAEDNI